MRGITKLYPGVVANDAVDFTVEAASIHGLLGENGAGKSTLMKVLFGLTTPTAGTVEIAGQQVVVDSARDALDLGIGMVQQHFSLIADFRGITNGRGFLALKSDLPVELFQALPYVVGLVTLVFVGRAVAPAAIGRAYVKD